MKNEIFRLIKLMAYFADSMKFYMVSELAYYFNNNLCCKMLGNSVVQMEKACNQFPEHKKAQEILSEIQYIKNEFPDLFE